MSAELLAAELALLQQQVGALQAAPVADTVAKVIALRFLI